MLRSVVPQFFFFGRSHGAALVLVVTTLASTTPAWSQPLPAGVEKAIFGADQFAQPITISVPYVTEKKQLDAFRNARPNSLGMSPIAPSGHVERSDSRIRLYCELHWIVLDSITTREGVKFDYALASAELKKLGQQSSFPIAKRKLKTIDYRNRYKANPLGMGERDIFAITFSYTIESSVAALHSPSTVFKGKATAQQDPEDGEWKLEKLTLSDEGEEEFYKLLSTQPAAACDASIGAQDPGQGMDQRTGQPAQGTASSGIAFIIVGDDVPVFGSDKVPTVIGRLAAGTPAANAKGTFLEESWRFALEEINGRTHIIYLKSGRKKVGWVDSGQLRRFAYDCSCGEMCDPFVPAEGQGSAWNACFERARSSFVSQSATPGAIESSSPSQGTGTALQASAPSAEAKGQEALASPEITVPLGKTAGNFTFSKGGALSYKGKSFNPAVQVKAENIQSFRISMSRDGKMAGAIAEDVDGQNSLYLLDLGTLTSTPLQKPGTWSAAQRVFWSPSGRHMLALCAYEGQRFIGANLNTKKIVEGDFLGREGKRWVITDEPQWDKGSDSLRFTVNETCDPYNEDDCDPERVLATYKASLDPATLKITTKRIE